MVFLCGAAVNNCDIIDWAHGDFHFWGAISFAVNCDKIIVNWHSMLTFSQWIEIIGNWHSMLTFSQLIQIIVIQC